MIEEFTSSGSPVGSWDTYDHIPVGEWDPQWYGQTTSCPTGGGTCYDVYHWNSIEYTGSGFMVSYRHLDAVYNIVESTSQLQSSDTIQWKLGSNPGQPTTEVPGESLTVTNDPVFTPSDPSTCTATPDPCHFGGQHDARLNGDGTVSLYDDGTGISPARAPRAVRYAIDTTHMTATLMESITDAAAPQASICCGSARKLAGGDWVIGWGGTNVATENAAADGSETLRLQFDPNVLIYRMVPLTSSQFNLDALRAGMDEQYANSTTAHSETNAKPPALTP
ncbi:MAG TPA: aryl-sulfate sulfotransferase [Acidimicrobiia bacterium]